MSEKDTRDNRARPRKDPAEDENRVASVRSFLGTIACVAGILLAILGFVSPFFLGPASVADIMLQAVGVVLGVVGFYLGAGRLAVATIVLCVLAAFFGLAASQGLVPGIEGYDRGLPSVEPISQSPGSGTGDTND